ncbi:MAG TPA: sce7726 family protein [Xanthomonadales bacterium]|nr:sce7726 family protein [Xanthomonadales bacterium]
MYERLYAEMRRSYRTEYLYKNEVIRRVFEARHDPDRSTVLLERPIAGWKSRIDMLVVNDTTSAYEIKTDRDDLSRLRRQTDLSLATFDRVFVVASESWADAVLNETDERVGVYALRAAGSLTRRRPFTPNADNVDAAAVFSVLRRAEYLAAIADHFRRQPPDDPRTQYDDSLALFRRMPPRTAHAYLLRALRARFVRRGDARALRELPYALAHLYYKASAAERVTLFSSELLGRPLG